MGGETVSQAESDWLSLTLPDWLVKACNCHLIYQSRQIAKMLQSIKVSLCLYLDTAKSISNTFFPRVTLALARGKFRILPFLGQTNHRFERLNVLKNSHIRCGEAVYATYKAPQLSFTYIYEIWYISVTCQDAQKILLEPWSTPNRKHHILNSLWLITILVSFWQFPILVRFFYEINFIFGQSKLQTWVNVYCEFFKNLCWKP